MKRRKPQPKFVLCIRNDGCDDLEPRKVEIDQYSFYQKWYHSAIQCLLLFHKFSGDFKSLAAKMSPAITVKEAKESIHLLEDLGFIRKQDDGSYQVQDARITTGDKWQSAAIRNYQEDSLKLAAESLTRHPKELRDISTVTMTLSSKNLEEVKARIKELRHSLLHMRGEGDPPDTVYQVNVQVFPLTQAEK